MWTATLTVLFSGVVVVFLDQNCRWSQQNLSAVPLGTTSVYYEDIVSTTELIYNLMLGSDCNYSKPKAELWYARALAVVCIPCTATAETTAVIRCGLRGSVDSRYQSFEYNTHGHSHGTLYSACSRKNKGTCRLLLVAASGGAR